MKRYTPEDKTIVSKLIAFTLFILDYIYREISVIPRDLVSEIHLRYARKNRNPSRKILGYWDFHQRLAKYGDFLTFLEVLNVLRLDCKLVREKKNIDLCFIDDSDHYNASNERYQRTYQWKKTLMDLAATNPFIDTIYYFKSNVEFEQFYVNNRKRYIRWPPTISGSIPSDCTIIEKHAVRNGSIPYLNLPKEIKDDIINFYHENVYPAIPVVVNIRQNKHWQERNSNIDAIRDFIKHYEKNQKYKFIIICNPEEFPKEFRSFKNVLFSKDFFHDVEHDLGLIHNAKLSIFPSSGMACYAWFSNSPFIQYGPHGEDKYMFPRGKGAFLFFNQYQRHFRNAPTTPWLTQEFEKLVADLERRDATTKRRL